MPAPIVHTDDEGDLDALAASRSQPGSQDLPQELVTGEALETLVGSRNLLPAIPFIGDDVGADRDFIEACIDLVEPQYVDADGNLTDKAFIMQAGETVDVRFKYNVGYPNAHAFGVFFFPTFRDSVKLTNPVVLRQPSVVISPQVPVADATGYYDQFGVLRITTPSDAPEFNTYYGALIIYQEGVTERSVVL